MAATAAAAAGGGVVRIALQFFCCPHLLFALPAAEGEAVLLLLLLLLGAALMGDTGAELFVAAVGAIGLPRAGGRVCKRETLVDLISPPLAVSTRVRDTSSRR